MDVQRIARGIRNRLSRMIRFVKTGNMGPVMVSSHFLTDESFLSLFNLEDVKTSLKSGDVERAKSILLDYYQNRTEPIWPRPSGTLTDLRLDLEKTSQKELVKKAEEIVDLRVSPDGKIPGTDNDGNISWSTNLTTTPEWLWRLNRHAWWAVLGLAYDLTGDERYTKVFTNQMCHWINVCPPPKKRNERSPHWRLMETAMRMRVSWIPSFAFFLKSKNFSSEEKMTMLRSIYDHAKFLSLFKTRLNHLLREINGLATVSIYFPEFYESKEWLDISLKRLDDEIRTQVNLDGSHVEVSTGYQWLVIDELETIYDLFSLNGLSSLVGPLETILKRMYELLVYVIRPDWTFPEINDGFLRWKYYRIAQAALKFKRNDFLYVGSGGVKGEAPLHHSKAFDNAGWYVMRSDWSTDARYLFFKAGPHGGYHGHEDKLSIEAYAFGQSFIADSGSYTYEQEDPYRAYFVGSQGHNTILVNGLSQIRRWMDEPQYDRKRPGKFASWFSDDTCDYVSSCYAGGYAEFGFSKPEKTLVIKDVKHRRDIVFVKPDYWIMVDEIKAEHPYEYEMLFHTPPGVRVKEAENKKIVLTKTDDGPGLCLIPADGGNVDVSWLSGAESPIQGWYSLDHLKKTQSNVVIYRCNACESVLFITVLYPYRSELEKEQVVLEPLSIHGGEGKALRVVMGNQFDYFMFSKDRGNKQFGGFESSGNVCLIRTDREERVLKRFDWEEKYAIQ